jgi:hypothetical protein
MKTLFRQDLINKKERNKMDSNVLSQTTTLTIITITLAIWSLPWMAIGLWKAARRKDMVWFIILLLVHTAGILDILYIFLISKKKQEV